MNLPLGGMAPKRRVTPGIVAAISAVAVILPLIFLAVGQSTGLLLVTLPIAIAIGSAVWAIALALIVRGASRFTRDRVVAG